MAKRKAAKRTLINTGSDKRYVRRDSQGQFKESDDVSRSLANDRPLQAKKSAPKGQGKAIAETAGLAESRIP